MNQEDRIKFVEKSKRVVKQLYKYEDNLLAFLRTKDEDLQRNWFYGDEMLHIWLSKDESVLYIRSIKPVPKLLVYINESKCIEKVDDDVMYHVSHINSLLKDGPITLYVCSFCGVGSKEVEWDNETVKPLKGRLYRYTSIVAAEEDGTPYCCPNCKKESLKKDIKISILKI